jgi:ATP-binding cassette, subfamily B (MDR/TAP), member 7
MSNVVVNSGIVWHRYDESLAHYAEHANKTQSTLSVLNVGQNAIFSAGLTAMMLLTVNDIAAGLRTSEVTSVHPLTMSRSASLMQARQRWETSFL